MGPLPAWEAPSGPRLEKILSEQTHFSAGENSLSTLPWYWIFLPGDIFLRPALERMREVGPVTFVCPTILLGPGKGRTRNLGNVTKCPVPISSAQCWNHTMLWGRAGWGRRTGGGRSGPAGNPRLPWSRTCGWCRGR